MTGTLIATVCFALLVREQNSQHTLADSGRVLKLGHSLDQNHPVHKAMIFMAEKLHEKSAGRLQLQVFPNGQLGAETELIEQLQRGALAMAKTSTAPLESFIPEMAVFGVPYVFRDEEHFWTVLEGETGKLLLEACLAKGLRGLCYYDAGARSFYSIDRPILSPSDLRGLKIRVQKSKTAMDMVAALGASPTPVPYGELYTALQQKMVDGAENNPPSFFNSRHFEVCKHLSLDEHTRVPDLLLMSEMKWKSLSTQEQQWVQSAAEESARYQRQLWKEGIDRVTEALVDEGVTIHTPEKMTFAKRVSSMHQQYRGSIVGELLTRISAESANQ